MWIFLPDSFLSVVAHRDRPDDLLVRARSREDLERVFPFANVFEDPTADYRYRSVIGREVVAKRVADAVRSVEATNFKGAVREDDRHDAYLQVWGAMSRWGRGR